VAGLSGHAGIHTPAQRCAPKGRLREISKLSDAGPIRPIVDKVYPFAQTPEALGYVETGRAKGKVVVAVSQ